MIGAAIALTLAITGAGSSQADEQNRLAINKLAEMTALVRHSEACPEVPRQWAIAYVMLLMMAPPAEELVEVQERKMLALRASNWTNEMVPALFARDGRGLFGLPAGDTALRRGRAPKFS